MHRNADQHALAAAIRRADMRLRRALIIHTPAIRWAITHCDRINELNNIGHVERADRRLRMLCAAAKPGGAAQRARVAAVQTLDVAATWLD